MVARVGEDGLGRRKLQEVPLADLPPWLGGIDSHLGIGNKKTVGNNDSLRRVVGTEEVRRGELDLAHGDTESALGVVL